PSHTPRRLEELRGSIGVLFITKRPRPARPRAVKMSKTRYPVNRKLHRLSEQHCGRPGLSDAVCRARAQ
ncbi:hypothetical protein CFN58_13360, partial [Pseudomonas avellanae]